MFWGIVPSSQEYGIKSMSLKKCSVGAEENIFTQPGTHLGCCFEKLRRSLLAGWRGGRKGRPGTGQSGL